MATTISYAPTVDRPWTARVRRAGIGSLVIAAVAVTSIWVVRFSQQVERVYQQSRAMSFELPQKTIVLSIANPADQALASTPDYFTVNASPFDVSQIPWLMRRPTPFWNWAAGDCCVFLHQRRNANKPWRLVSVRADRTPPFNPNDRQGIELSFLVSEPATLAIGTRIQPVSGFGSRSIVLHDSKSTRLFAGQIDPADDSHFTISHAVNGLTETIDGWLCADDTVKLEPRNDWK